MFGVRRALPSALRWGSLIKVLLQRPHLTNDPAFAVLTAALPADGAKVQGRHAARRGDLPRGGFNGLRHSQSRHLSSVPRHHVIFSSSSVRRCHILSREIFADVRLERTLSVDAWGEGGPHSRVPRKTGGPMLFAGAFLTSALPGKAWFSWNHICAWTLLAVPTEANLLV